MKKIVFLLFVSAAVFSGRAADIKYIVSGSNPSFTDGKYIYLYDYRQNRMTDSALIRNSAFSLCGSYSFPAEAILYMGEQSHTAEQISDLFYLENGTIQLKANHENFICYGTPLNDKNNEYRQKIEELHRTGKSGNRVSSAIDSLIRATIRENQNILGISLLNKLKSSISGKEVLSIANEFPREVQQHPGMVYIREWAGNIRTDLNKSFIDITGPDPDGRGSSLRSVVENSGAKYMLVEFWATWCSPCRKAIPSLKQAYEQYHAKGFDIFGVSFDSNRERWRGMLKAEGMIWPQILPEPEQAPRQTQAWQDYSLDGIPANFLIDCASGIIVAKNLRGEALAETIAKFLD